VERETEAFFDWMRTLQVKPSIVELRRHLHEIANQELQRFRARMGNLTQAQEEAVQQMTTALVNKLLHAPTLALKRCTADNGEGTRVRLIREILGLDPPSETAADVNQTEPADPDRPGSRQETG
jgi:glutamyl-tRNA reductase